MAEIISKRDKSVIIFFINGKLGHIYMDAQTYIFFVKECECDGILKPIKHKYA